MEDYISQVKELVSDPNTKKTYYKIKDDLFTKVLAWGSLDRKRMQYVHSLINPSIYLVNQETEELEGYLEHEELLILLALHLNYHYFNIYDMIKIVDKFKFDIPSRELIAVIHIYVFIHSHFSEYSEEEILNSTEDVHLSLILDVNNFTSCFNHDNLSKAKELLIKYDFLK